MSLIPLTRSRHRLACAVAAATALGVTAALASSTTAQASDIFGPGYSVPGDTGLPSHLGSYGAPGAAVPGVNGQVYGADPSLAGPVASLGYGPSADYTTWRRADGTAVAATNVRAAAFIASQYGATGDDVQAAAAAAALTSELNPGTTDALPDGARANARLSAPGVPAAVRSEALSMIANASRYPGPYTLRIRTDGTPQPHHTTGLTLSLTAQNGQGIPEAHIDLVATEGGRTQTLHLPGTDSTGTVRTTVTPTAADTITLEAQANNLPAPTLTAVTPHNPLAQRLVIPGTHTSARTHLTLNGSPTQTPGRIQIIKRAANDGHVLAGVEFVVKDDAGRTVADGRTNSAGMWQTPQLAPGRYTLHEAKAAAGYTVAADRPVTVTSGTTTQAIVTDTRIPAPTTPAPRTVPPGILPQTGA